MDMTTKYFKYVPHHQVKRWEEAGWVFEADLGPPHAAYSSLYSWPHEGEPVIPENIDISVLRKKKDVCDGEQSTDV